LGVLRRSPLVTGFLGVRHQEDPDADTEKIPRKVARSGRTPAESPPETAILRTDVPPPCRAATSKRRRSGCAAQGSACRETRRHHRRRRSGALLAIVLSHEKAVTSSGSVRISSSSASAAAVLLITRRHLAPSLVGRKRRGWWCSACRGRQAPQDRRERPSEAERRGRGCAIGPAFSTSSLAWRRGPSPDTPADVIARRSARARRRIGFIGVRLKNSSVYAEAW